MKPARLILPLLLLLLTVQGFAQTTPRFSKYDVSSSGCKIYLPAQPDPVTLEYSPDSSQVYTIEALDSAYNIYFHFGAIVVKLKEGGLKDNEKEDMVIAYMDYLKTAFNITGSAGYGKGHTLDTHPGAMGVIDFWEDKDKDQWAVKGWATENFLVVMFLYGPKDYPNENVKQIFFKGIRFPGD